MGVRPKGAGRLVCSLTGLHNQELGRGICAFKRADHKKFCARPVQEWDHPTALGLFAPDQSSAALDWLVCLYA